MFCTGCGTQSADSDLFCGGCGHAQRKNAPAVFHVGQAVQRQAIPDGVKGWSWGAFLLNWIWAVGNNTWIGMLALIPLVNIPVMFWLGIRGRELAWRNRRWDSLDHFNRVQRQWSQWAVGIMLVYFAVIFTSVIVTASHAPEAPDESVVRQDDAAPRIAS